MEKERWGSLAELNYKYEISNNGRFRRLAQFNQSGVTEYFEPRFNWMGYLTVRASIETEVRKSFFIHRLIAIAFIPNPDSKPCINHINGIKADNRLENLEWCTTAENNDHALRTGLRKTKSGPNKKNQKLTEEEIKDIFVSLKSPKELSIRYNISKGYVRNIKSKRSCIATTHGLVSGCYKKVYVPVKCILSGYTLNSYKELADVIGVTHQSVLDQLTGVSQNKTTFRFVE